MLGEKNTTLGFRLVDIGVYKIEKARIVWIRKGDWFSMRLRQFRRAWNSRLKSVAAELKCWDAKTWRRGEGLLQDDLLAFLQPAENFRFGPV